MSAYDTLAASYDGLMADGAYRRRAAFLERRLSQGCPNAWSGRKQYGTMRLI